MSTELIVPCHLPFHTPTIMCFLWSLRLSVVQALKCVFQSFSSSRDLRSQRYLSLFTY